MGPGVTPDVMWAGAAPGAVRQERRRRVEPRDRRRCTTTSAARTERSTWIARRRGRTRPASAGATQCSARVTGTAIEEQRALFRRWPAGVSVVVAEAGGRRAGLTVSSLVSLSLEPPLVGDLARALGLALRGAARRRASGRSRSSPATRTRLAQHFARSVPPLVLWDGIPVRDDDPRLLAGAVGLDRRAHGRRGRAGDHVLFVGEVLEPRARSRRRARSSTSTGGTCAL